MSRSNEDWTDYLNEIEDGTEQGGKRSPVRAHIKSLEDQVADLTAQLEKAQASVSQRSVADVLQSRGVKPALSRYILRDLKEDGTDVTPESVSQWLTDNAEMFGINLEQKPEGEAGTEAPGGAEGVTPDDIAALRNISTTEGTALAPEAERSLQAELESPNLTEERLLQLMGQPASRL